MSWKEDRRMLSEGMTYESGLGEFWVGSFACCDRFWRVAESPWFVCFSIDRRRVDTDDYDQHRTGKSSGTRPSIIDIIDDEQKSAISDDSQGFA